MESSNFNITNGGQKYERRSVIMSPKKSRPVFSTNLITSPPIKDSRMFPWNWGEVAGEIQLSPTGSCRSSSEENGSKNHMGYSKDTNDECQQNFNSDLRRGRPRLDAISSLIMEGTSSRSAIRCRVCNRVFPREKSLQAHMRTHTGERPYICDYPDCGRPFAQSGQLKTHQRLHTGEKPFICSEIECHNRFTHANRHCPKHPSSPLQRDEKVPSNGSNNNENQSEDVTKWLEKYYMTKNDCSTTKLRERKLKRMFEERETETAVQHVKTICLNPSVQSSNLPPVSFQKEDSHYNPLPIYQDTDDKLIGALALIELGAICTVTTEGLEESTDVSSPLDLSSSSFTL